MKPSELFVMRSRTARKGLRLSQGQLAELSGVPRHVIQRMESGRRGLLLDEAVAISDALAQAAGDSAKDAWAVFAEACADAGISRIEALGFWEVAPG